MYMMRFLFHIWWCRVELILLSVGNVSLILTGRETPLTAVLSNGYVVCVLDEAIAKHHEHLSWTDGLDDDVNPWWKEWSDPCWIKLFATFRASISRHGCLNCSLSYKWEDWSDEAPARARCRATATNLWVSVAENPSCTVESGAMELERIYMNI